MQIFKRSLLIAISLLFISACGGGDDATAPANEGVPTDPTTPFSFFPATYFSSYNKTFNYTGSVLGLVDYTANSTEATVTTVKSLIIDEVLTLRTDSTDTNFVDTVGSIVGSGITFSHLYSGDINAAPSTLLYTGYTYTSTVDGSVVTAKALSTNAIPAVVKIGESGLIGSYTRADKTTPTFDKKWALADGFNGFAKLILTTTYNDINGDPLVTVAETSLISEDGTRNNKVLVITYLGAVVPLTLTLTSL